MLRKLLGVFLLVVVGIGVVGCDASSSQVKTVTDAGFNFVDFVLTASGFELAADSVVLLKGAVDFVETLPQDQTPPTAIASGYTQVSISYLKKGVYAQDIYRLQTGVATLGVLFEGGKTFESISQNRVSIDATQTQQIWIVPLENATHKVTIRANAGWQNTGIFLVRGKQYDVKYLSGVWSIASGRVGTSDAAGQPANPPKNLICHCGEPLPGVSTQALIGRIGAGLDHDPVEIGDNFSGVAYDNDFLYLRINLPDSLLAYAGGQVALDVSTNNAES
ncbi:MAG: hypothetical protein ACHQ4H_10410 [Ktedonobacterales bacterium]